MNKIMTFAFIILQLFVSHTMNSQSTWEFTSRVDSTEVGNGYGLDEAVMNFHRLENGDLLSMAKRYYLNNPNDTKTVLRLHKGETGEAYKEVVYNLDSVETLLSWAFYDKEKKIFTLVGSATYIDIENEYKKGRFLITRWDKDLNLLSDTLIDFLPSEKKYYPYYFSGNYTSNGDYLVFCRYTEGFEYFGLNEKEIALLINKDGKIEKYYIPDDELLNEKHSTVFEDKKRDRYVLFGQFETIYLNKDFKETGRENLYTNNVECEFLNACNARMINGDTVLFTADIDDNNKGLAYLSMTDMKIKKAVVLTTSEFPVYEFFLMNKSMDYIDTSAIYFALQGLDEENPYYTISKVNSELEPYWIKYFSLNDTLSHFLFSVMATPDGGVVIGGSRWHLTKDAQPLPGIWSWIKKFDAEGNSLAAFEPVKDAWAITIYPNPSEGEFKIRVEGEPLQDTKVEIFDMHGYRVESINTLHQGENNLELSELPQGMYLWRILKKGKVIGTGKWNKF